ncbi:DUF1553 domain-containing protein [Blastopirellula sp. JC732]|uniref:DUF1553 domain-containing protein n=1 Tax=Blastopirellula sediminis TaxID=2894196 RepID=A0A9X1SDY4_9BACT|nr:DUF1553 domain-containing protein [Blastopirellula sediminis]MCC9608032.1 DUF1553 domain-containing protein [Blastopirellula sediminis]MCC9627175.1 DUF1553 domain-containing protein [Blastopirellula sediminis]
MSSSAVFAEDGAVDYQKQIKPLLKARCYACHGALKQEGSLRLDTAVLLKQGGDSGAVIALGDAADTSELIQRISTEDLSLRMPPDHEGEPFHPHEIDLFRKWIAAGAPAPEDERPEADVKDHWSFRAVKRPELPPLKNSDWVRNPIDVWVAASLEENGLTPVEEASRIVLLRRLYLDLIGVPPTAEEIAAAEADMSPDWYEKVVDRLLADPRYGERWARHWMDVWRYSDWWGLGDGLRNSQRHMWHWRDWIVESLNEDESYDEMVRLMLAADELAPNDPEKLRASGYLARNYFIFNRDKWMDEVVTHVGKGFLGLTLNCAKCHDHKFDPIPQEDYYRMRAFFEPYHVRVDMTAGTTSFDQDGISRAFDAVLDKPTYLFVRGDEAHPDKSREIAPGVPEIVASGELQIKPLTLPEEAWKPGLQSWVLDNYLAEAQQRFEGAQRQLERLTPSTGDSQLAAATSFEPIIETFDSLDPKRWKMEGEGWTPSAGKLEQKLDGSVRRQLTLLEQAPPDFEVELRYQLLGGSVHRSVGIDFDVPPSGGNDAATFPYVYLSGSLKDAKVQAAFQKEGTSHYPGDGRQPYSVELNRPYVLTLRVRGDLINVSVNGEHRLAWRSPLARRPGAIRLMTFDAIAEIDEFQLRALDPAAEMVGIGQASAPNGRDAFEKAQADLEFAEAELQSIQLRIAAIESQQSGESAELQNEKRLAAIRGERRLAIAAAQRDRLVAEQSLVSAKDDAKKKSQEQLNKADKSLQEKLALLGAEIGADATFTPFVGAKWYPTRFQHTGRDDPTISFAATSTGRRTALANWITNRSNPLTARVAVNHLWARHFGKPLAANTFDLGRNSPTPTHHKLIDWLAAEFMENQWSMKQLHRLIVTSATYRMTSSAAGAKENLQQDPDNHLLWRREPIRLESQAIRDTILELSGTLDVQMGGPSVPPAQQEASRRRSLYFYHSNNDRNLFLTTFDEAEVTECYRRDESVVPQQALAMTNSKLVLEAAPLIAKRIGQDSPSDDQFIEQAFAVVLGIHPSAEEMQLSRAALDEWKQLPSGSAENARERLIWILLNHNDFVTIR